MFIVYLRSSVVIIQGLPLAPCTPWKAITWNTMNNKEIRIALIIYYLKFASGRHQTTALYKLTLLISVSLYFNYSARFL